VHPFGVVELQRPDQRLQDAVGDAGQVAALEPGVVVDAYARQQGHLFPPHPGHPAVPAVVGQPGPLRRDLGTAGGEEVANLGGIVHAFDATTRPPGLGGSGMALLH
jgi:hypothetical protein